MNPIRYLLEKREQLNMNTYNYVANRRTKFIKSLHKFKFLLATIQHIFYLVCIFFGVIYMLTASTHWFMTVLIVILGLEIYIVIAEERVKYWYRRFKNG